LLPFPLILPLDSRPISLKQFFSSRIPTIIFYTSLTLLFYYVYSPS
jgi:hypothetical protein